MEEKLTHLVAEGRAAADSRDYEKAARLRDEEVSLRAQFKTQAAMSGSVRPALT